MGVPPWIRTGGLSHHNALSTPDTPLGQQGLLGSCKVSYFLLTNLIDMTLNQDYYSLFRTCMFMFNT